MNSIYTAMAGLSAFSAALNVVGNNLANINTTGFKYSEVSFEELIRNNLAALTVNGAGNPFQFGMGTIPGSVSGVFTQGAIMASGESTYAAIQGNGFFVLGEGAEGVEDLFYTRAGNFSVDGAGYLVNPDGRYVLGYTDRDSGGNIIAGGSLSRIAVPAGFESLEIDDAGRVRVRFDDGGEESVAQLAIANFNNPKGLARWRGNLFTETVGSGAALTGEAGVDGRGNVMGGALEKSNVEIAREFTEMVVLQQGYQAGSSVIRASDENARTMLSILLPEQQ